MTDHAALRRARANRLDADRNSRAIAESRLACLPAAASRVASVLAEAERDGEVTA